MNNLGLGAPQGANFDRTTETSELYDAVLTGLVAQDKPRLVPSSANNNMALDVGGKPPSLDRGQPSTDKHSLYVGNFSWVSDRTQPVPLVGFGPVQIYCIRCTTWLGSKGTCKKTVQAYVYSYIIAIILLFPVDF